MSDTTHLIATATVWPCLTYRDAHAAVAFLERALGFASTAVHTDDDGRIVHAEARRPDGAGVMFGTYRAHPDAPHMDRMQPGGGCVYVVCADPDAEHERAVAAGAEIVSGLHDTDYGSRDFTVADPEGNLWAFGTYGGA